MVSFHDKVVEIIAELCEEYKTPSGKEYYSSVYAHLNEWEYKPLVVAKARLGQKPLAENYYADVWAKRANGRIDVYEVFHSETVDQAVTDMFLASLVKNIEYFHIVCTDYNLSADKVEDLKEIVLLSVRNENGKSLLPCKNAYVTEIPEKIDRRRRNEIKKYLSKALGFQ